MEYSEQELKSMNVRDFTHPEDVGKSIPKIENAIHDNVKLIRLQKRNLTKSGKTIWVQTSGMGVKDLITGYVTVYAVVEDKR